MGIASLFPPGAVGITCADGSAAVFTEDDVRRYDNSQFPARLVYGTTSHAGAGCVGLRRAD